MRFTDMSFHNQESLERGFGELLYKGYGNDKVGEMCVNEWYNEMKFCKENDNGSNVGKNLNTSMYNYLLLNKFAILFCVLNIGYFYFY